MVTERSDLERWVAKGLISEDQARAIADEATHADFEKQTDVDAKPRHEAGPGSSLLLEGMAYVGGAVALTAALVALGLYWDELSAPGQLGIPIVLCLALLLGGVGLGGQTGSARRIGSALWAAATVLLAVSIGTLTYVVDLGDKTSAIVTTGATVVFAAVLYGLRRSELQQILLFASCALFLGSLLILPESSLDPVWYVLAYWALGLIWVLQTWAKVFFPPWLGYLIGSATMVIANVFYGFEESLTALIWGGATAVALVAFGIAARRVVVFIVGAISVAALIAEASIQYLGGSFGALLALFAVGAVLLGGVVVLTQLRRNDVA